MNQIELDNRNNYLTKIAELKDDYHKLSTLETDFIEDIENKLCDSETFLTEKQIGKLEELHEKHCN